MKNANFSNLELLDLTHHNGVIEGFSRVVRMDDLLAFSPPARSGPFTDASNAYAYAPFLEPSRTNSTPQALASARAAKATPKQQSSPSRPDAGGGSLSAAAQSQLAQSAANAATNGPKQFNFQVFSFFSVSLFIYFEGVPGENETSKRV